jgi:hypothetical protein
MTLSRIGPISLLILLDPHDSEATGNPDPTGCLRFHEIGSTPQFTDSQVVCLCRRVVECLFLEPRASTVN